MASDGKVTVTSGTFSSDAVTGSGGGFGGTGGAVAPGSTGPGTSDSPAPPGVSQPSEAGEATGASARPAGKPRAAPSPISPGWPPLHLEQLHE